MIVQFVVLLIVSLRLQVSAGDIRTSWDDELRLSKLESLVDHLQRQVSDLTGAKVVMEAELATTQEMVKNTQVECSRTWTLKRTQIIFANLEKLTLSGETPTYVETMPVPLPNNTRALLVQVFGNMGNNAATHGYLTVDMQQEGNEEGGVATLNNEHYNVYYNTFTDEVLIPWNDSISNKLQVKVIHSHRTGGDSNWYRIRVVGYVLA